MIPLVDLQAQYRAIKDEVRTAIDQVLESGQFVLGPELSAFEAEFAVHGHARSAIGVNSGTSALHLALLAADIGPGDEVITVPFTFAATAAAIEYVGARPVFVDIDPTTFTMDPTQLEQAITERTKAILPVHLYGQAADMDPILEIAAQHDLIVIEDAAQAHGAEYKGQRVGALGDMGCFSFYPGKNLGAYGEGGMVVTNHAHFDAKLRMLRNWGQETKYLHAIRGFNYRLETLQAAILRVKLRYLESWTEARRYHAEAYNAILADSGIDTPIALPDRRHVYHIYAVRVANRDAVHEALHAQGIHSGIHYPIPVHLQPAYADLGYRAGDFPHSERAAQEVLSLPLYPELTHEQIETVCETLMRVVQTQPDRLPV